MKVERKVLKIGLYGFGCVGHGLYKVLNESKGIKAQFKHICVKDPDKVRPIDSSLFTYDKYDILDDDEVNIVVELIDDADAAFEIVSEALKRGKSVVSANKKMIAEHFNELMLIQKNHGSNLLYEAAACASIPIIRNLEEYYDNDVLNKIEGIVNGSTNFILSKSHKEELGFEEALLLAQNLGYAESDPSLDVDAFDAVFKLQILCAHAFGLVLDPAEIFRIGIRRIGAPELKFANEHGYKIKLVAQAFKTGVDGLCAFVLPAFVNVESNLYQVDDVFNGIMTETVFADRQFFSGKGAGAYPTASAVLSDLSALTYDYAYEYKKIERGSECSLNDSASIKVYLRSIPENEVIAKAVFTQIDEVYQNSGYIYITGTVIIYELRRFAAENLNCSILVLPEICLN